MGQWLWQGSFQQQKFAVVINPAITAEWEKEVIPRYAFGPRKETRKWTNKQRERNVKNVLNVKRFANVVVEVTLAVAGRVVLHVDVDTLFVASIVIAKRHAQRRLDEIEFDGVAVERLKASTVT